MSVEEKNESRTIVVLYDTVVEDTSHGNGTTREVRIVVEALTDFNASRCVNVTGQQ